MIRRAIATRSCGTIVMRVSSLLMPITAPPYFLTADSRQGTHGRPRKETGGLGHLEHALLPLDADQMDAGHAGDLAHGLDELYRDLNAFLGLAGGRRLLEPVDDRVRHVQSRDLLAHVASTASRARDADRGNDEHLVEEAEVAHHRHEACEERPVEDQLGLNEIGARPAFR